MFSGNYTYTVVKDWQLAEIITDAGYSAGSLHL
jgi:hypothetical protein